MKTTTLIITMLLIFGCKSNEKQLEDMNETIIIQETISSLFINSDNNNWDDVEHIFAPMVNLDYSSMTENPAANVTPTDITTGWKTVLPGFTNTHHQVGNFIVTIEENKASAFCYGPATHFIEGYEDPVWTVVGSYDFELEHIENRWRITDS